MKKKLTGTAQYLRKNMTDEECHLWYDFLKSLPITIKRQKIIENYIVDFYCASCKIIIELDGSQHYEDPGIAKDAIRDQRLREKGYEILRYSNRDIKFNFQGVCEDIYKNLFPENYGTDDSSLPLFKGKGDRDSGG